MLRNDPDSRAEPERIIDEVDALRAGRLDRGQFVRRVLALGLSVSTASTILTACGAGLGSDANVVASKVPEKITGPLNFTNWASFIGPKQVPAFERRFRTKVRQSFYASNEDLLSKVRTANGAYDVALPGGNAVQILIATGGLEPLQRKWIPNADPKLMLPRFQSTKTDPENRFAVPNDWSFHGIGVRKDLVDEEIAGWEDLWRLKDKYSKKITVMDDQRNTIGAALKLLGYSHNSTKKAEVDEAVDKLIELKPHLLAITSSNQREMLLSGQAVMGMDWNQSAAGAAQENANLTFVTPQEGSGYYVDFLIIPRGANNIYTAHRFIDFLHRPEQYAQFVSFTTTAWTKANVVKRLPAWMQRNTWLNPPPTADLEYQVDLGSATTMYGDAWTRFKSA